MALFEPAIEITLKNEGSEYTQDPLDPGGATRYGISQKAFPKEDIKNLTEERAKELYRINYWKYDGIIDQGIANKLFDAGVNMGEHTAVYLIQELVLQVVKPDGLFGPVTEDCLNRMDPQALLTAYRAKLVAHYEEIVKNNPAEAKFLKGWTARANQ
jgi:lysozyme family protein